MNEKIKELWEKTTCSSWPRPGKFTAGEYDHNLLVFAKSIMLECADACSNPRCGRDRTAQELIRDHFGVE